MGLSRVLCVKQCEWCGKDVEIRHKKRLEAEHTFCSRQCLADYRKATNSNNIRCANCGKLVHKKPSEVTKSRTGQLCCSIECSKAIKSQIFFGDKNPNYGNRGVGSPLHKSDATITNLGYRLIALHEPHPFAINKIWIREHRYIAEKYLMGEEESIEIDGKKYLRPDLDVHHKDGNKLNNSIDNLQILSRAEHIALHNRLAHT